MQWLDFELKSNCHLVLNLPPDTLVLIFSTDILSIVFLSNEYSINIYLKWMKIVIEEGQSCNVLQGHRRVGDR